MKRLTLFVLLLLPLLSHAAPPVPYYVGKFAGDGTSISNVVATLSGNALTNGDTRTVGVSGLIVSNTITSTASGTTLFTASGNASGLTVTNSFDGTTAITAKGAVTSTSGTRTFTHDSTHTIITNSSTLTASEWTAGSQFEWYNGTKTVTIDKTNGAITATTFTGALTGNASGTAASTTDAGTYWGAQATLGTNTLTLNNKYYYFNAANDTSITNLTVSGGCWAVLAINNTNASTTIHTRCDVSGIGIIGTVAYTANTNGLVVAAGKTAFYSVVSMSKTNYSNAVQQ